MTAPIFTVEATGEPSDAAIAALAEPGIGGDAMTEPIFEIVVDGEIPDSAIAALARLLLAAVDDDQAEDDSHTPLL